MATAAMARTMTETVGVEPTLQMRLHVPNMPKSKATSVSNKLRNRLRLDPSRALEPARKKIATIEAQRVMSVFEDTIVRSEIMTLLPYIIDNLERFRINLGSELSELIEHHAVILRSYDDIKETLDKQLRRHAKREKSGRKSQTPVMSPTDPEGNQMLDEDAATAVTPSDLPSSRQSHYSGRGGLASGRDRPSSASSVGSNFSMDSQVERTVRSLTMVAQQLNTSCKNVLRAFQTNPSAMNSIKNEFSKRVPAAQEFVTNMHELKDILLNKLLTTPEEEKERMDYIQEISKRERNNASVIDKLEAELKAAQDDKDEEVSDAFSSHWHFLNVFNITGFINFI